MSEIPKLSAPPSKGNLYPRKIWSQTAPDFGVYSARIDSGHTQQRAGELSVQRSPLSVP